MPGSGRPRCPSAAPVSSPWTPYHRRARAPGNGRFFQFFFTSSFLNTNPPTSLSLSQSSSPDVRARCGVRPRRGFPSDGRRRGGGAAADYGKRAVRGSQQDCVHTSSFHGEGVFSPTPTLLLPHYCALLTNASLHGVPLLTADRSFFVAADRAPTREALAARLRDAWPTAIVAHADAAPLRWLSDRV